MEYMLPHCAAGDESQEEARSKLGAGTGPSEAERDRERRAPRRRVAESRCPAGAWNEWLTLLGSGPLAAALGPRPLMLVFHREFQTNVSSYMCN